MQAMLNDGQRSLALLFTANEKKRIITDLVMMKKTLPCGLRSGGEDCDECKSPGGAMEYRQGHRPCKDDLPQ